jgi:hypothetical protein
VLITISIYPTANISAKTKVILPPMEAGIIQRGRYNVTGHAEKTEAQ